MKRIVGFIMVLAIAFGIIGMFPTSVSAASAYTIGKYVISERSGVNLRSGAGTGYKKVSAIPYNQTVQVTEVKGSWGKTTYGGKTGWFSLQYAVKKSDASSAYAAGEYVITERAGVNLRSGAGTGYKKVSAIPYNKTVNVTSVSGSWGKTTYNGKTGWFSLDYAKKAPTGSSTTMAVSAAVTSIPTTYYQRTGVVYTVGGKSYYQALTTKDFNGVGKGFQFYVDSNASVVCDQALLEKLRSIQVFNHVSSNYKSIAADWANAAEAYYDIVTYDTIIKKVGSIGGKGVGICLNIVAGNALSLEDAMVEVIGEVGSPEAYKAIVVLGLARLYSNNCIAYATDTIAMLTRPITSYEDMIRCQESYSKAGACMAVCEYLIGDKVRAMANSSTLAELTDYAWQTLLGFSDSVLPDITAAQITKYTTDGVISLTDFGVKSGAEKVFTAKQNELNSWLNKIDSSAEKATVVKLTCGKDWNALVGKTVASIKNNNGYTKWYGSGNISANAGYTGQCTWYALGRFYETTGIALKTAPNAKKWLTANKNDSRLQILYGAEKIVSGSICVDTNGSYGHVCFIEHVEYENGKPVTVYFTEANWDGNGTYNVGKDCILKKLSYSQFVSQRSPDGYIVTK